MAGMATAPTASRASDRKLHLREVLDWMVEDNMLTRPEAAKVLEDARSALRQTRHPAITLGEARLKMAKPPHSPITPALVMEWLAGRLKMPFYHIDPLKIDLNAVTRLMSSDYASKKGILPVEVDGQEATIAVSEPFVSSWEADLSSMLRLKVKRALSNPVDIERYQGEFFNLAKSMKRAESMGVTHSNLTNFEQLVEMGKAGRALDANDHHIVHLVDWLWQYAFDQRASDIHVEPRRDVGILRFRIDGVLHEVYQLPYPVLVAMTARIKILGRMDVVEKRRPQDGRIKTRMPTGEEIELRLSTLPTAHGEKLVMRIFDPEVLMRDWKDLGFSQEEYDVWQRLIREPGGIVLVTGPTGSGKTTTLYTTLKQLATPDVNVCTIEDPIEMIDPRLNQMQVQTEIELTFAAGVRALMRQDPDIIMVGEVRDLETAEMAIQAALTGHLVFSTLHTNDAASAITRLVDLGVAPYLISATVIGVLAQRLVRTLCPACKQPDAATTLDTVQEVIKPWRLSGGFKPCRPVGCLECRMTGYRGRAGLYVLLSLDEAAKAAVHPVPDAVRLRQIAAQGGLKPLRMAGVMKVAEGLTTLEEVLRSTPTWE
jgi:general secretion pathway protein E